MLKVTDQCAQYEKLCSVHAERPAETRNASDQQYAIQSQLLLPHSRLGLNNPLSCVDSNGVNT